MPWSGRRENDEDTGDGYWKENAEMAIKKYASRPIGQILLGAVLAALVTACGGDRFIDNNTISNPTTTTEVGDSSDFTTYFVITSNEYNILKPNFYYSSNNERFWTIQAAIAQDVWDVDYRCVVRIDIQKTATGDMPAINKTFSIEENPLYEKFPGAFLVFNGEKSTRNKVEHGILSFTADSTASGTVRGSFDLILADYDSTIVPVPEYHLTGIFSFKMGSYGPAESQPVMATNDGTIGHEE